MCTTTQPCHGLFRILLYRNDAKELLLETRWEGFRLPVLTVPSHRRIAEELTAAIRNAWNIETYCLFSLPGGTRPQTLVRDQVAEACNPSCGRPAGMEWLPVVSLSECDFESPSDLTAVEDSLRTFEQYRRDELPGFFGKAGWLRVVTGWVEEQAVIAGLRLTSEFRQLNASPTFSLMRFGTDGPALWFKAVGAPNLHEYPITLKLATAFPEFVPHVVGTRPEWNAWLALEDKGAHLDGTTHEAAWAKAADRLALLQIASLGRGFEFIDTGCKDLRPCALRTLADPFFEAMAELMDRQTKPLPESLTRPSLYALERQVIWALEEMEADGVPNTLSHLDMNPGNIVISDANCIFLDWAEAYVGPPFLSFQYLLEHYRRLHGAAPAEEILTAYTNHWALRFSTRQMETSLRFAPLLGAFAYAAGSCAWRNLKTISPETAALLRSLVRRMNCEMRLVSKGDLPCLL